MMLHIDGVLSAAQLARCEALLAAADWRDGRVTAGPQSAQVKANEQVAETCAQGRALGQMIVAALEHNALFMSAALPRHVYPPLFNRYGPGMAFGRHIDNALRQVPGTGHRIRTDISATLFLSAPENYDGGELMIEEGNALHRVKLPAGDMVLYPASTLHYVTPVTRGTRVASFFWVQSLIRDRYAREVLFDMDRALQELAADQPDSDPVLRLTGCYHNLLRRWADG